MPAFVTHYLFALRVLALCKKAQIPIVDRDMTLIGAQGPDIFFFHRVMPWQNGVSYAQQGRQLHHISPAKLLEGFRAAVNIEKDQQEAMIGYMQGFLCHYALDRAAHPFVLYWQQRLAEEQPHYGTKASQYHFRIESALDTIMLRRETGRLMRDFKLNMIFPVDSQNRYAAIGRLYKPIFSSCLSDMGADARHIALAAGDMRQALSLMTDRSAIRQKLLHPIELVSRRGHSATSLLRPLDTDDWDYANENHRQWKNPFDESYTSKDSFSDIYQFAAAEAVDMIRAFLDALSTGASMEEVTQDRGFSSDLPGIYA